MKILDCTLRDGGYYTNWDFKRQTVDTYIEEFNHLPVEYLELGYRSKPLASYYGEYFYCPVYLIEELRKLSDKKLVVMLNEKDVTQNDVHSLLTPVCGLIDMVRIAVDPMNLARAICLAEKVKEMGFEVGFNVMYMSKWVGQSDFVNQIKYVDGVVDYFYMVDSYGGVYPTDVKDIYDLVRSETNVELGFHGHNNLELGLINTLTAIECGVDIVDVTVSGMGRGAGNLKTELLLTALNAKGELDFEFNSLSKVVDSFVNLHEEYRWGVNLPYMVSGANSLPQKEVMEWVGKRYYSFNSIIRSLTNKSKGVVDNLELIDFDPKQKANRVLIVGGGPSGSIHGVAVREFLSKNPDVVVIHVSSKNVKEYKGISNEQIHCLAGNEGYRLENIFKDIDKENRIAILPPFPRTMGTYLPTFFKNNAYQLKQIKFIEKHKDSATVLGIQTALDLDAEEIYFIGYDGYSGSVSMNELELFNENEVVFQALTKLKVSVNSLNLSRYNNLPSSSVYALI